VTVARKSRDNPFPAGTVVSDSIAPFANYFGHSFADGKARIDIFKESFSEGQPQRSTMGIRGQFGSGKTHLAFQLADYFTHNTQSRMIYTKIDHVDFLDLYKNAFARKFDEESLKSVVAMHIAKLLRQKSPASGVAEVRGMSLTDIAQKEVDNAVKTNPQYVLDLVTEDLLPVSGLGLELDYQIEDSPSVARDFFKAYSRIKDSNLSKLGVRWIRGEQLTNSEREDLGLDLAAINQPSHAKEAMRFLLEAHRKANIEVLFCVDEFERIAVRGTPQDRAATPGLIKDLAEMFSKTGHIFLLSGIDDAWSAMPADVFDRINRQDIIEMRLTNEECEGLIDQYCTNEKFAVSELFERDSTAFLFEVGGRNPRQVLHIAHHAFQSTGGKRRIGRADIVEGANKALSDPNRIKSVQENVERVAQNLGLGVQKDRQVGDARYSYVLGPANKPSILVNIMQSIFKEDEGFCPDSCRKVEGVFS